MGRSARRFFQASCLVVSIAWLLAPVASLIINRQPRARHEAVVPLRRLRTLPLPRPWLQVRAASCSGQRLAVSDGLRAYSWNGTWQGPMAHCDGAPVASVGLSGERLYAGGEDRMLWPLQRCPQRHSEFEAIALDQLQGLALWNGELVMLEPHGDAWQVAGALPQPPKCLEAASNLAQLDSLKATRAISSLRRSSSHLCLASLASFGHFGADFEPNQGMTGDRWASTATRQWPSQLKESSSSTAFHKENGTAMAG